MADAATAMAQWHAWAHDAAKPLQTLIAPSLVRHCPISYIIVIIYHIIYIIHINSNMRFSTYLSDMTI